ncbi:methyltransferase [Rhodococcus sp. MALMAid1271]|uniref:methyltransferase n=1 Tax=Rhodococcus sp. MALMAid1271 TaxID=3411744 RepID=UPI003B9EADF8
MSQPEFNVEVASLDQHGDPGFVHFRGAFYTSRSAAQFALTQASALSDTREVDIVSVVIDAVGEGTSRRDVEFIGTPGELAAELTALPDYKNGVLRTVIPAPRDVTAAVAAVVDASPPLPDSAVDGPDAVAVLDVEVYSTRPGPIPNSRTEVGAYIPENAHRIAEQLAAELSGTVEPMRNDTVLRVTHEADVSDTDRVAVDRFSEVQRMRANLSVLDPVADAEYITALAADLEELQARSTPAARADNTAAVSVPVSVSNAVDVERASTRPRGLVTPPPTRAPSAARAASPTLYTAPAPTHTAAISRSADHGLG